MDPLVTLASCSVPRDGLGKPIWSPAALLGDLELRFGLPPATGTAAARVLAYAERIAGGCPPFLRDSFSADRLGTAELLLRLRDELIEGGWDGRPLSGAGARIEALGAIEALEGPALPAGPADRLAAIEQVASPVYDSLTVLPEELSIWPLRWRRLMSRLARAPLRSFEAAFPLASPDTDLGRIQRGASGPLHADGSVVLLEAETSLQLAEAVAADLARDPADTLVVRGGDPAALELALAAQGLPGLGDPSETPLHPELQLLGLALELEFGPRDPRTAIDLLLLPGGPIRGGFARKVATNLARWPAVGGRRWSEGLEELVTKARESGDSDWLADTQRQLATVSAWFDAAPASAGAAVSRDRVLSRIAQARAALTSPLAIARTDALAEAVRGESHALTRAGLHELLALTSVTAAASGVAAAGKVAHADDPRLVLRSHRRVLWWCFLEPAWRCSPWHRGELRAVRDHGIELIDDGARASATAVGWMRAVHAATEQLVLAVPSAERQARRAVHPLWDQLIARVPDTSASRLRVRATAPTPLTPAALPQPRPEWTAPPALLRPRSWSPHTLEALLWCPLKWALEAQARIRRDAIATLPARPLLEGNLAHRVTELLVSNGHLAAGPGVVATATPGLIEEVIDSEAAHLRLPGMSYQTEAFARTLRRAADALARAISAAEATALLAETPLEGVRLGEVELRGRVDLRGTLPGGRTIVIDLKRRSANNLRQQLERGRSVQLASYGFALDAVTSYFSVSSATLLSADAIAGALSVEGEESREVWRRVTTTVASVDRALLAEGRLPATGVEAAEDLAELLGDPEEDLLQGLRKSVARDEACEHCALSPICGRRWEEGT